MREPILVINAGSSSIKFAVFETAANQSLNADLQGQVEGIGMSPRLKIADAQGRGVADETVPGTTIAPPSRRFTAGSRTTLAARLNLTA